MGVPPAHPYIPNAATDTEREMLKVIGVADVDELLASIPAQLRMSRPLDIGPPLTSEYELSRHMMDLLGRNATVDENLSFLGMGCYDHWVPAVCGEVNGRAEFLTAYAGETYEDHGKWQALFEYVSLMAELLEMDVVNVPTYDGFQAAATGLRMAGRITGRPRVLVTGATLPDKLGKIEGYLDGVLTVDMLPVDPATGLTRPQEVAARLGDDVAAVYLETPNAYGVLERHAREIADAAHRAGAIVVCGTDPLALGFTDPPARWGADIVCGDIQSLGLGLHYGGAHGGFIATHDDERFVFEFPSRLFGLAPTRKAGELGFCDVAYERTSLARREEGIEWVGTAAALWGITAGVYLSLMGPGGMAELGAGVASRTRYAMRSLAEAGVEVLHADAPHWREFAVRYPGRTVAEVDALLRERGIFGGAELPSSLLPGTGAPGDGGIALVCVTEKHTAADIDRLAGELKEILR
ncbi:aminomethyl-transferring glycine dehydrogenase subunit GcvPA [Streptomyces sp. NPDC047985]|uniref:aminomethyl-transferring glycine dehydrogenase subunit GcvPA n=1 Tax=unclassified Streptomyces TaxID=2593676 RepID=UPI003429ADA8